MFNNRVYLIFIIYFRLSLFWDHRAFSNAVDQDLLVWQGRKHVISGQFFSQLLSSLWATPEVNLSCVNTEQGERKALAVCDFITYVLIWDELSSELVQMSNLGSLYNFYEKNWRRRRGDQSLSVCFYSFSLQYVDQDDSYIKHSLKPLEIQACSENDMARISCSH